MRLSIRAKVLLAVTIALVLTFGLTMSLLVTNASRTLRSSLNQTSKSFASLATTPIGNTFILYQDSGTVRIDQQVNNYLSLDPDVTTIHIISTDGAPLYSSGHAPVLSVSSADAGSFQPVYKYTSSGYIHEIIEPLVEDSGVHRYAIVYEVSSSRVENTVAGIIRIIFYIGSAVLVLSIIGTGILLNSLFIKPLRELSRSANTISEGDYGKQIISHNHDEIGDLAASVNRMAETLEADIIKLQELDKLKSEFMLITSHNLRTPLTIMRGYMETAQEAETVDELKNIIETVSTSVSRLHLLAEDVLTISTLEAGSIMPRTEIGLSAFINSIGEEFAPLAQRRNLHWEFTNQVPDDLKLSISQTTVRSALANLLDNALKFTKADGTIRVDAKIINDNLEFSVTDTGIGIAPEELPKLFTKFHRGTDTMHYEYEGTGLGLYLSKLILSQHGGEITVASKLNEGTVCTVTLPIRANTAIV